MSSQWEVNWNQPTTKPPAATQSPTQEERRAAMKEDARARIRAAFNTVIQQIATNPSTPEGIELYELHALPWCDDDGIDVLVEEIDGKQYLPRMLEGTVDITAPNGQVFTLPWWCGWLREDRIAVICCGL